MINEWLEILGNVISLNIWLAPLLALLAGVLTSFTPCSLSSIPLVIGYVGGYAGNDAKKAFRYSLVFCIGTAVTFTVLGTLASILGKLMQGTGSWWFILLGILMALMALQTWEIVNIIPQSSAMSRNTRKGYIGALLAGMLGGIFASPCATPVLVVLLAVVAQKGSLLWGILLLLLYSIGHSILLLAAGTSIAFVNQVSSSQRFEKYSKIFKIAMGSMILLLSFYMFYLGF
ncbi:MAG: cytochrome c biogenesis protein CcdA [Bacillota bacterium]|nr:cytochrome c biogenesis protein CcdA [Bacillota bacterium]